MYLAVAPKCVDTQRGKLILDFISKLTNVRVVTKTNLSLNELHVCHKIMHHRLRALKIMVLNATICSVRKVSMS